MSNQDTLIEKKLDGTLSAKEQQRFEHLLHADPGFAQAYQEQKGMIEAFRQQQKELLHRRLKRGYGAYQRKRTLRRGCYGTAAALLLVALGSWWGWPPSSEQLFASYYQPYEVVMPRGAAPTNRATLYYGQGQYAQALSLLRSQPQTGEAADYWTLLRGNAYLLVDSVEQAQAQFQRVIASSDAEYQAYGRWYLALSYLKNDQRPDARLLLRTMATQPGLFQSQAQQLLNDL